MSMMLVVVIAGFSDRQKQLTIFAIGDSTMADYSVEYLNQFGKGYPLRGWMQLAPSFFNEQITVVNGARSGRSSKSFRSEGFWEKIIQHVSPGDYVFIQFGHNDSKPDTARHTDPEADFQKNLRRYVNEVKQKHANPILFTSIPYRKFDRNGRIIDGHGKYVSVVRQLAEDTDTPLVDLNRSVSEYLETIGPEASKPLYMHISPGKFDKLPEGKIDDTHLTETGAAIVAELALKELLKKELLPPQAVDESKFNIHEVSK